MMGFAMIGGKMFTIPDPPRRVLGGPGDTGDDTTTTNTNPGNGGNGGGGTSDPAGGAIWGDTGADGSGVTPIAPIPPPPSAPVAAGPQPPAGWTSGRGQTDPQNTYWWGPNGELYRPDTGYFDNGHGTIAQMSPQAITAYAQNAAASGNPATSGASGAAAPSAQPGPTGPGSLGPPNTPPAGGGNGSGPVTYVDASGAHYIYKPGTSPSGTPNTAFYNPGTPSSWVRDPAYAAVPQPKAPGATTPPAAVTVAPAGSVDAATIAHYANMDAQAAKTQSDAAAMQVAQLAQSGQIAAANLAYQKGVALGTIDGQETLASVIDRGNLANSTATTNANIANQHTTTMGFDANGNPDYAVQDATGRFTNGQTSLARDLGEAASRREDVTNNLARQKQGYDQWNQQRTQMEALAQRPEDWITYAWRASGQEPPAGIGLDNQTAQIDQQWQHPSVETFLNQQAGASAPKVGGSSATSAAASPSAAGSSPAGSGSSSITPTAPAAASPPSAITPPAPKNTVDNGMPPTPPSIRELGGASPAPGSPDGQYHAQTIPRMLDSSQPSSLSTSAGASGAVPAASLGAGANGGPMGHTPGFSAGATIPLFDAGGLVGVDQTMQPRDPAANTLPVNEDEQAMSQQRATPTLDDYEATNPYDANGNQQLYNPDDANYRRYPFLRGSGATTPDDMAQGIANDNWDRQQVVDRAGIPVHDLPANPPFASVRGGPTMADPSSSGRIQDKLANYLETNGVNPAIADAYHNDAVSFGSSQGYGAYGDRRREDLGGFLNKTDDVVQPAQHEAIHRYDMNHRITDGPMFRQAVAAARQNFPQESAYLGAVPDPYDYAHMYTAAFDQGLSMDEIPPPLRRFYMQPNGSSLLNTNSVEQARLRRTAADPNSAGTQAIRSNPLTPPDVVMAMTPASRDGERNHSVIAPMTNPSHWGALELHMPDASIQQFLGDMRIAAQERNQRPKDTLQEMPLYDEGGNVNPAHPLAQHLAKTGHVLAILQPGEMVLSRPVAAAVRHEATHGPMQGRVFDMGGTVPPGAQLPPTPGMNVDWKPAPTSQNDPSGNNGVISGGVFGKPTAGEQAGGTTASTLGATGGGGGGVPSPYTPNTNGVVQSNVFGKPTAGERAGGITPNTAPIPVAGLAPANANTGGNSGIPNTAAGFRAWDKTPPALKAALTPYGSGGSGTAWDGSGISPYALKTQGGYRRISAQTANALPPTVGAALAPAVSRMGNFLQDDPYLSKYNNLVPYIQPTTA